MRKTDVVKYYGGTESTIAKVLGISRQAVNQWPAQVPKKWALELADLTAGNECNGVVLKFDREAYKRKR